MVSSLPDCWLHPFSKLCGNRYRTPRCLGNSHSLWPPKLPSPLLPLQPYHFTSFQFSPVPSIPASPVSFLATPPFSITFYVPSSVHHAPSGGQLVFIQHTSLSAALCSSPLSSVVERQDREKEKQAQSPPSWPLQWLCLGFHLVPVIQARNHPPSTSFQGCMLSVSPIWHLPSTALWSYSSYLGTVYSG